MTALELKNLDFASEAKARFAALSCHPAPTVGTSDSGPKRSFGGQSLLSCGFFRAVTREGCGEIGLVAPAM
jgi:hypothetical protein